MITLRWGHYYWGALKGLNLKRELKCKADGADVVEGLMFATPCGP